MWILLYNCKWTLGARPFFFTWEYETYHRQTQDKKLPVVKIKDDDVMAMFYTGSLIFAMFWGCLDMHAFFDLWS